MVTAEKTTETTKKIIEPNAKQKLCINQLDGPVMALAGPGTGKTFTVVKRIKHILEEGIEPSELLCLTYSDAAAREMKMKLVEEIGSLGSSVMINTYHAFCNEVIRNNPEEFEMLEGLTRVDDISARRLMKNVIDEMKEENKINAYVTESGSRDYFIGEHIDNVGIIKKSRTTKEEYFYNLEHGEQWQGKMDALELERKEREQKDRLVPTFMKDYETQVRKMGKAREAWEITERYNIKLKNNNFIDYNDMINFVLKAFSENRDLLKRVSQKYKYFLVDEYQDTNYAQNDIVFYLAEGAGHDNIFVVGDDDQIIYEFQGAKTDTLVRFLKRFPHTKVFCLEENNRSTQTILDFSYQLINQDTTRLEKNTDFKSHNINKRLIAKNEEICKKDRKIRLHSFGNEEQERNYIVEEIEQLIKSSDFPKTKEGEPKLSSVAILAYKNNELAEYAKLLKAKNIKYQIKNTQSIMDLRPSMLIYFYLTALYNPSMYADKLFTILGSEPFKIDPEDYYYLITQNRLNHKYFIYNIEKNRNHYWQDKDKIDNFINTYNNLKKEMSEERNVANLIISICNQTGILKHFMECEKDRDVNILSIKRIIEEAQLLMKLDPNTNVYDFIKHLETAISEKISLNIQKEEYIKNAVQLVTLHSSKGRQFEYVYMPHLISSEWENRKQKDDAGKLPVNQERHTDSDEATKSTLLRLLFVGMTRAQYDLTLSYPNLINGKTSEMTTLISQIAQNNDLIDFIPHELSGDEEFYEFVKSITQKEFDYPEDFKEFIKSLIKDYQFSPSSLNTFRNCKRNFLYSNVLSIPTKSLTEDTISVDYGSAIHKTIENAEKQMLETGKYPELSEMLEDYEKNLGEKQFKDYEKRQEILERGKKSLTNYYPHFVETSDKRLVEYESGFNTIPVGEYFIQGKIDRVEQNNDGTYMLIDYKTGKPKSHKQISDGGKYENYLNQLRFYKLAYEIEHPDRKVSGAGLEYPEHFDKPFYIVLTSDDDNIIREHILNAYKDLHNLNFEPAPECDRKKACEYCEYKNICELNLF